MYPPADPAKAYEAAASGPGPAPSASVASLLAMAHQQHAAAAAAAAARPRALSSSSVLSSTSSVATTGGPEYMAALMGVAAHHPGAATAPPPVPHYLHAHAAAYYPHHHHAASGKGSAPLRATPYGATTAAPRAVYPHLPATTVGGGSSSGGSSGGGGGGHQHQGVWSAALRAEYRGWLQTNRGISKETSITYSHAVHGVLKELVQKRIRDGRVGLPTHGMDAAQLRALIEEQPHEAERIIKRDKRSSYFRYLKEFLGMAVDDNGAAPAPASSSSSSSYAAAPASQQYRATASGGIRRPSPSSSSYCYEGASSSSSLHHAARQQPPAQPTPVAVGEDSNGSLSRSSSHHLLVDDDDGTGSATGSGSGSCRGKGSGALAMWSPAVRLEYQGWLEAPQAAGGWGLGPEEAVGYAKTGHVLLKKVLADSMGGGRGPAYYQALDREGLARALQGAIDVQPGLLARVIKGPRNRRLFQPLQKFFGIGNGGGGASSSAPGSATSSPTPAHFYQHYHHSASASGSAVIPPHHQHQQPILAQAAQAAVGASASSCSSSSSSSSSPVKTEPVWSDGLRRAYRRWLELDRGFGDATVQTYVQSAVHALRSLIELRVRALQQQDKQPQQQARGAPRPPTSNLTASEAAALLREFGSQLAGGVDTSQAHFRYLKDFLFGSAGVHDDEEDEEEDDDDDEEEEEEYGRHHRRHHHHRRSSSSRRRHHHHDEDDDDDDDDDDVIIVAAAPAPHTLPSSARPSPERRPYGGGSAVVDGMVGVGGSCGKCRDLGLDLADREAECAQWRARCETLSERVRSLERALAEAERNRQPTLGLGAAAVASFYAMGATTKPNSRTSSEIGEEEDEAGLGGSGSGSGNQQQQQEEGGYREVTSRHPKKMRLRAPASGDDEGEGELEQEQDAGAAAKGVEGNNQLLPSGSSGALSASSGGTSGSASSSASKMASLLSACSAAHDDEPPAAADAAGKNSAEPKLVAAVQA